MAGEIALWLRVLAALSKDKTLVPRAYTGWFTGAYYSSSKGS